MPQPAFDPYVGNRLASAWARSVDDVIQPIGLIMFPMGEAGQELSAYLHRRGPAAETDNPTPADTTFFDSAWPPLADISPVTYSARMRHQNDVFVPCTQPVAFFPTPIHQIVASPSQALVSASGVVCSACAFLSRAHSSEADNSSASLSRPDDRCPNGVLDEDPAGQGGPRHPRYRSGLALLPGRVQLHLPRSHRWTTARRCRTEPR